MTGPHVTVVGDVGVDVTTLLSGPVSWGHDTRASVSVNQGGAGGNTAAWLVRLGARVSLIARVGDDQAGRSAVEALTQAGVDCRFAVDPVRATCCVVVLVAPEGERTMLSDRGANAALQVEDIRLPPVAGRGHLHLSGYVLLDDESRAAGLFALARARRMGWTTSVDPQAAPHIDRLGAQRFLSWVDRVDLLLPNDAELAALGGRSAALRRVAAVAVTHGRRGASWYSDAVNLDVPAGRVAATDSTGAGDAFNAGLLTSWLDGADPMTALASGISAGLAAATGVGARPRP